MNYDFHRYYKIICPYYFDLISIYLFLIAIESFKSNCMGGLLKLMIPNPHLQYSKLVMKYSQTI